MSNWFDDGFFVLYSAYVIALFIMGILGMIGALS